MQLPGALFNPKLESTLKKVLIFSYITRNGTFSYFLRRKLFLYFGKRKPRKNSVHSRNETFSYFRKKKTLKNFLGGNHLLFHSASSTRSGTFRHTFATLHVRWLSHIFNRTACIYQTATQWDLPPYRIIIWLIDDAMLVFVFLLDDFILGFFYSNLRWETGGLELASTITLVLKTNRLTNFRLTD